MALRIATRRAAGGTATAGTAAAAALYYYNTAATNNNNGSSPSLAGFRREYQFWSKVGPIVLDYYLQTASSSPLVRYQAWRQNHGEVDQEEQVERRKQERKVRIEKLHEKHAPAMLQVLLELKGLYIKLGQVLSVTALPIPEPYRVLFRTLQSDVPGWEEFDATVKPVLEQEFGVASLEEIFEFVDPIPCGAASIGQAHRARLKKGVIDSAADDDDDDRTRDVILKVQYPNASWQVPADIQCVGDFLKVCVWAGVVDEQSAQLSFDEFARQFLAELDYRAECNNLRTVYQSSLDPAAPYQRRNVILPAVYEKWCTDKVITMTYLPGPKLEAEARRQLEILGLGGGGSQNRLRDIVRNVAKDAADHPNQPEAGELVRRITKQIDDTDDDDDAQSDVEEELPQGRPRQVVATKRKSPFAWTMTASRIMGQIVGVDSLLWSVRMARRILLWTQAAAVSVIQAAPTAVVPSTWHEWSELHRTAAAQAAQLSLTKDWMDALFDVHGHQIFSLGLFHADPHPGNILVVEENEDEPSTKLGLIDFGQCKRLTPREQVQVAQLILSVANEESDLAIATAYRNLNIKTKNDSTEFLALFGRLMFGPFRPEHLSHEWHRKLHEMDRVLYFPNELSMVYRTALLLRGLAVSLQLNYSVGHEWKTHAQATIDQNPNIVRELQMERENQLQSSRMEALVEDQSERTAGTSTVQSL